MVVRFLIVQSSKNDALKDNPVGCILQPMGQHQDS
jgi:hypothetical protein